MSATAKALGGSAPPHKFEHRGKTYPLRMIDWDMKVELERNLYAEKVKALEVTRKAMEPAAYQERLDALTRQYEDGEFDLASPEGNAYYLGGLELSDAPEVKAKKMRKALKGLLFFAGLVFGCTGAEMARLIRERAADVTRYLSLVVRESLLTDAEQEEVANTEGADPNSLPPAD